MVLSPSLRRRPPARAGDAYSLGRSVQKGLHTVQLEAKSSIFFPGNSISSRLGLKCADSGVKTSKSDLPRHGTLDLRGFFTAIFMEIWRFRGRPSQILMSSSFSKARRVLRVEARAWGSSPGGSPAGRRRRPSTAGPTPCRRARARRDERCRCPPPRGRCHPAHRPIGTSKSL